MTHAASHRYQILATIDYSEVSTSVVEHAVQLAQQHRPCQLHFVHINHFMDGEAGQEGSRFELIAWLGARLPQAEDALDGIAVTAHELRGEPVQAIVQLADELHSDLVILGTHGRRGLARLLSGSVSSAVSRRSGCSVLVLRNEFHDQGFVEHEPACALCVEARLQSQGNVLWCHDHWPHAAQAQTQRRSSIAQWLRDGFSSEGGL